jgi:RNA polymerase sigma-70 factor (family 1)
MSKKRDFDSDIVSFKNGNEQFFEALYISYFEKLCVYSLNYISDQDAIKDLVQDVFVVLWTNRKKTVITTSLNSYLYKMVYYKIMDVHRSTKKKNALLSSFHKDALDFVIESDEDYIAERLKKLENCIEELPEKCKKVFIAKKITNLKNEQITEELNISIKTIEGHITKAFKFIRNCMNPPKIIEN